MCGSGNVDQAHLLQAENVWIGACGEFINAITRVLSAHGLLICLAMCLDAWWTTLFIFHASVMSPKFRIASFPSYSMVHQTFYLPHLCHEPKIQDHELSVMRDHEVSRMRICMQKPSLQELDQVAVEQR